MTALSVVLCIVCQLFLVAGQLFLKHAMTPAASVGWTGIGVRLIPGIACMTVWFFLWLGLLQTWELSRIFPFEGLNPALVLIGSWLLLKEKMTLRTWAGIGLISTGIGLVATS